MNATRVAEIRNNLGWTQARLAEALRVTEGTVTRWENGQTTPSKRSAEDLERVAEEGVPETVFSKEQIRDLRQHFGYIGLKGARRLASEVGVHWRTVYHWQEGVLKPSRESQAKLEAVFKEAMLSP